MEEDRIDNTDDDTWKIDEEEFRTVGVEQLNVSS